MSVVELYKFRVKPGRAGDVASMERQANERVSRLGLPKGRMFNTAVGGDDTLSRVLIIEYEDLHQWSNAMVKSLTAPDYAEFARKWFGEDSPVELLSRSLLTEVTVD
jgi:hypothetical protein